MLPFKVTVPPPAPVIFWIVKFIPLKLVTLTKPSPELFPILADPIEKNSFPAPPEELYVIIELPKVSLSDQIGTVLAVPVPSTKGKLAIVCNAPVPSINWAVLPAPVTANVPAEVIGEPATENPAGIVSATLVIVPCGARAVISDTPKFLVIGLSSVPAAGVDVPSSKSLVFAVALG